MDKIIQNLKSGNYEVVDKHGVSVTNHFTECLEKGILELKQKVENAEHERHEEWKTGKEWKWQWQKVNQELEKAGQDKISFATEKVVEYMQELKKRVSNYKAKFLDKDENISLVDIFRMIDVLVNEVKE